MGQYVMLQGRAAWSEICENKFSRRPWKDYAAFVTGKVCGNAPAPIARSWGKANAIVLVAVMTSSDSATAAAELGSRLAHHELGGRGPEVLLMLHATGFLGQMFAPMVEVLGNRFRCIAIDLPGHGASSHLPMPPGWRPEDVAVAVHAKLETLGLTKGCFGFGHSWGGSIALTMEVQQPGTFAALYVYEPVVCNEMIRQALLMSAMPRPPLASIALRRRDRFESTEAARQLLQSKPPFSTFDEEVVRLYVQHGLSPTQGGDGVELRCRREVEAEVYSTLEPPPSLDYGKVRCPVTLAVGRRQPGVHERLVVFGTAVQQEVPGSRLERFQDLLHLGPFEKPLLVARSIEAAFTPIKTPGSSGQRIQSKL